MQLVQRIAIATVSIAMSWVTIQAKSARAASLNIEPALSATGVDTARSLFNLDGTGIKIGVISTSFNTATTFDQFGNPDTYATDIANGYLPAGIQVIQDNNSLGATDEGRAILELVHAVAPGASLAFASALPTTATPLNDYQAFFASEIQALQAAGANIIVDDIEFYNPPFNTSLAPTGPIDRAVTSVFERGVAYFTSAGNQFPNPTKPIFNFKNDPNAATVGAVYYGNDSTSADDRVTQQGQLEPFSSAGQLPFLKPDAVAPDGLDISFNLGGGSPMSETTGFYSFVGTSASAPFAAAVGSLLLQADPNATPSQIYAALKNTASQPPGFSSFNSRIGYGLIQADKAIAALGVKPKSVPEPTSVPVLLALGTLGVGLLLRRHRQQQVLMNASYSIQPQSPTVST